VYEFPMGTPFRATLGPGNYIEVESHHRSTIEPDFSSVCIADEGDHEYCMSVMNDGRVGVTKDRQPIGKT